MVVSGGPAGMEAARIAALRGHEVTLYEKKGMLDGLLDFAAAVKDPHENPAQLKAHLERQLELTGVTVVANTEVDATLVAAETSNALVLACGGAHADCGIVGIEAAPVIPIDQVMFVGMGPNVAILGSNARAVDCAVWLQCHGEHVTMVTSDPIVDVDKGQSNHEKEFIMHMLYARGMRVWE